MGKMGHSCTCQTLALESRLNLSMKKLILNLCALAGIFYGEAVNAADKSKVCSSQGSQVMDGWRMNIGPGICC